MKIKFSLTVILLFLCSAQIVFAQEKYLSGGIINGHATKLPTPEYPQAAKDLCASGQVKVQVLVDEDGNVISAEAVSGDELLRASAIEAAKNAKFRPTPEFRIKVKGFIVYNFPSEKRCIEKGVINKSAIYLPKPEFPKSCRCAGQAFVRVLVDAASGKVVAANAFSGHPLLRASAAKAAREARFQAAHIDSDGKPVYVKGILVYDFDSDGSVQTEQTEIPKSKPIKDVAQGILIGKAIKLSKPVFPSQCRCKFLKNYKTVVQFTVNENGNVVSAYGVAGHPLLKAMSVVAIRNSKFYVSRLDGAPVKAFGSITYDYVFSKNKFKSRVVKYELKLDKNDLQK